MEVSESRFEEYNSLFSDLSFSKFSRVLTAEASKQVLFAKSAGDGTETTHPRFLDVDALKKQPKLL